VRNQVLFAPSFFKAVSYFPDESQLLTSGTDRKVKTHLLDFKSGEGGSELSATIDAISPINPTQVAYWEAFDGSLIRELEGSQSDSINGLDISQDGKFFVIGGSDKLVKVNSSEQSSLPVTILSSLHLKVLECSF
jgi:WD40 repeat protein